MIVDHRYPFRGAARAEVASRLDRPPVPSELAFRPSRRADDEWVRRGPRADTRHAR